VTASYTGRALTTPKSGKVRSVPLAPVVGEALARLGQRAELVGEDDLVFPVEAQVAQPGAHQRRLAFVLSRESSDSRSSVA
jgi:hypothetical protein